MAGTRVRWGQRHRDLPRRTGCRQGAIRDGRAMRRVMAALVLVVGMATGCATALNPGTTMASWLGRDAVEVITQWGPPSVVQDIGGGRRVLIWRSWVGAGT